MSTATGTQSWGSRSMATNRVVTAAPQRSGRPRAAPVRPRAMPAAPCGSARPSWGAGSVGGKGNRAAGAQGTEPRPPARCAGAAPWGPAPARRRAATWCRDGGGRRLTYLFIAHDLAVVKHIADQVAVMYLGKIVERAPAPTLYGGPRHPYTTSLLSAVPVPDPKAQRQRIVLAGEVPSPAHPPPGCPFHPRCPHPKKDPRCRTEPPALREVAPGQLAACHFAEEPL